MGSRRAGDLAVSESAEPRRVNLSGQVRTGETGVMDDAVRGYRDEIASEYRPMFDRLHRLIVGTCPDAEVVLSYGMPTYRLGRRRLNVGCGSTGYRCTCRPSVTAASPGVILSWPPGRGPSSSGRRTRRASPTRNSGVWCAPRCTPDVAAS